jgi:hypothetical protein
VSANKKSLARRCGTCNACCTTHGVPELKKIPFSKCEHLALVKGCGIYNERPKSCRDFECLWLQGAFEGVHRPDRLGIVFSVNYPPPGCSQALVGHVIDSAYLGAYETQQFLEKLALRVVIILSLPDGSRKLMGPAEQVQSYASRRAEVLAPGKG